LLPLKRGGEFVRARWSAGRKAALALFEKLRVDAAIRAAFAPELDIVVFATESRRASQEASVLSRKLFESGGEARSAFWR